MVNCLILEDEPLAQRVLQRFVTQTAGLRLVGVCDNGLDAMACLRRERVDLLFLDVQLPRLNGVEFARSLAHPPGIVFTTAYPEFAVASYELEAVDYLLKPIAYERFLKSVSRFTRLAVAATPQPSHTYFKVDGKLVKLAHADIVYAQSMRDYLLLKTDAKSHLTHMTMKHLETLLPSPPFRRVHRSYLVNVDRVTAWSQHVLELGTCKIPVGENYRFEVRPL
jgi:two-component system LytT family response regulator